MKNLDEILERTARMAKEKGMQQSDINASIKRYRDKKKKPKPKAKD